MKNFILLLTLVGLFIGSANADDNDNFPKNEVSIMLDNSPIQIVNSYLNNAYVFSLNYNRNIVRYLGVGGYLGSGTYRSYVYQEWYSEDGYKNSLTISDKSDIRAWSFGANINLHLLSLILKKDIHWVNCYFIAKIGGLYLPTNEETTRNIQNINKNYEYVILPLCGTYFDTSLFGGVKVYPFKRLGIFGEYGYRLYKYYSGFHARYGISFSF